MMRSRTSSVVARLESVLDEAMSEYSREMEISVEVLPDTEEKTSEGTQGEDA